MFSILQQVRLKNTIKQTYNNTFDSQNRIQKSMQTQDQLLKSQEMANLSSYTPLHEISHLSPYHERVSIEKQYLKKKQQLRSILIMGHLQKMELNAINNKSIQMMLKAKKAEEMSKKKNINLLQQQMKKPQNQLKIDSRKKTNKNKEPLFKQIDRKERQRQQMEKQCQELIDKYMKKVKQIRILENGTDRKKVIEDACITIRSQLAQKFPNLTQDNRQKAQISLKASCEQIKKSHNSEQKIRLPSIKQSSNKKKQCRKSQRSFTEMNDDSIIFSNLKLIQNKAFKNQNSNRYTSITQIECNQNLRKLEIQQSFLSKQRNLEQRMFLRKMKMIGMSNLQSYKTNYKSQNKQAANGERQKSKTQFEQDICIIIQRN